MRLSESYPNSIKDGRKTCHFRAPFDAVLFLQEALHDPLLSPADKVRLCVRLTFGRRLWPIRVQERRLNKLLELLAGKPQAEKQEQIMDFEQDAALIRSAFKQQYGIDL